LFYTGMKLSDWEQSGEDRYKGTGQIKYQKIGENYITKTFLIRITPNIIKVRGWDGNSEKGRPSPIPWTGGEWKGGHVACMDWNAYKIESLKKPMHKWKTNIKIFKR
jgi:hypothetical protein